MLIEHCNREYRTEDYIGLVWCETHHKQTPHERYSFSSFRCIFCRIEEFMNIVPRRIV